MAIAGDRIITKFSNASIVQLVLLIVFLLCAGFFTMIMEHSIISWGKSVTILNEIQAHRRAESHSADRVHSTDFWRRSEGPAQLHHCKPLSSQHPAVIATTRFAVVSLLTSDNTRFYTLSAIKLAKSLRWWFSPEQMDLVLMVTDGFGISTHIDSDFFFSVMELENAGWNVICKVPVLENQNEIVNNRFHRVKVYSKLNMWALTEYEATLFLDLDTLAVRSPIKLFTTHLPAMKQAGLTLGAVRDRPESWSHGFNAGVIMLTPVTGANNFTFPVIVNSINSVSHDAHWAEQGLLNSLYKNNFYDLSFIYNANLASKMQELDLWNKHKDRAVILHYTVSKGWMSIRHLLSLNGFPHLACWFHDTDDLCQLWDSI